MKIQSGSKEVDILIINLGGGGCGRWPLLNSVVVCSKPDMMDKIHVMVLDKCLSDLKVTKTNRGFVSTASVHI